LSFKVSDGNILTLTVPLVITVEELDRAIDILERALDDVG
jgi:4-aminobutyrate aminotransferase